MILFFRFNRSFGNYVLCSQVFCEWAVGKVGDDGDNAVVSISVLPSFGRRSVSGNHLLEEQVSFLLYSTQYVDELPNGWMVHLEDALQAAMGSLRVIVGPVLVVHRSVVDIPHSRWKDRISSRAISM